MVDGFRNDMELDTTLHLSFLTFFMGNQTEALKYLHDHLLECVKMHVIVAQAVCNVVDRMRPCSIAADVK